MTDYIILKESEDGAWRPAGTVRETSSPTRAIRVAAANENGVYVAVPARSWKPLTVKVEQTTKVTIG